MLIPQLERSWHFARMSRNYFSYFREPFQPLFKSPIIQSAEEAVKIIKSSKDISVSFTWWERIKGVFFLFILTGDSVFVHSVAATPTVLLSALAKHGKNNLENVTLHHIHIEEPLEYLKPEYSGIFRDNSFFIGSNARQAVNEGRADYTPIFLSEIPLLFQRNIINIDVALINVIFSYLH